MAGHPHAELMLEYAKDLLTNETAFENWEFQHKNTESWIHLTTHPNWSYTSQYRRKPKAIGVVEGRSVFQGDTLYCKNTGRQVIADTRGPFESIYEVGSITLIPSAKLTWAKPVTKVVMYQWATKTENEKGYGQRLRFFQDENSMKEGLQLSPSTKYKRLDYTATEFEV